MTLRKGYSHLKEEALDRTVWRARFGRGFGPVVRQTTKWMNVSVCACVCVCVCVCVYIGVCIRVWALRFSRRWLERLPTVVLNVTPCSLVGTTFRMNLSFVCLEYPENVRIMYFWNSRMFMPDETTVHNHHAVKVFSLLLEFLGGNALN